MTLYVGTSGWAFKEWKPDFYPADLPSRRFLEHYCRELTACEINATFYRMQDPATFERWAQAAPDGFRFTTKAHRRLTHTRNLDLSDQWRAFLDDFVRSISTFGSRLGGVMFQIPAHRPFDERGLEELLARLEMPVPFAMEFRDPSWQRDDVAERVAAAGGTVCLAETEGAVPERLPPGPIGYIRLRAERYSEAARRGWLNLLGDESRNRDVYAFTKHEGIPVADRYGGLGLARWLVHNSG